jgi:hypothetical protein
MSFSHRIRMRLIRRMALSFAVAAVVTPSAMALDPALLPQQDAGAASAYGELHQFPNAGLVQAYGELHQFPNAGVVQPSVRAIPVLPVGGSATGLPTYSVDGPRTGPATSLPTFSVDGPRSGPANVTETPLVIGSRFGRPDLAPNTGSSDVEIAWPEVGTGLGIGIAVALGIAALGMGMTRRRGTLQGA